MATAATTAFGQTSASAPKPVAKTAPIERIEIESTDNNGFLVRCYKKTRGRNMMAMAEPSKHIFSDIDSLQSYIGESFGGGPAVPEAAPDTAVVETTEEPVAPTDMAAPSPAAMPAMPAAPAESEDDEYMDDEAAE